MSIVLKINGTNRSDLINFDSLEVRDNLYSKANECYFTYEKFGSRVYVPAGGDEIGVWDGATKIFGGKITNVKVKIEGKILVYDAECKDWVDQLDGELVTETYESKTVNQIIADIQSKYATTFNITNVNCTTNIEAIYFDMKPVSKCLDQLAEIAGYHWYVDPDKKIYFFAEGSITSPFDITDTNGKCLTQSLEIEKDYEQIKNRVNITGGSISNVQVFNQLSIDDYGEHEVVIKDDFLTSTAEATQKANAVLAAYKDPIKKGGFESYDAGLVSGQRINVNSTLRGVNQDFIIESVGFKARTPTDFVYKVRIMTQQDKGLIGLLEKNIMAPLPDVEATSFGDKNFNCNIKFSIVNYHKIEWEEGHIIMSSGEDYTIAAGNREFTNSEIWYFNPSVSETTLQFSSSFGDGVGNDRISLGYAIPNPNTAKGAQFIPKGFMGGVRFWGGENVVARTIIAEQIAFDTITGDEISIKTKLAINDRTFGNKGIQLDYNAGTPRAYIGDGANKYFKYDGVNISWKAQNTELDASGNLIMIGGSITGSIIQTATSGLRMKLHYVAADFAGYLDFLSGNTILARLRSVALFPSGGGMEISLSRANALSGTISGMFVNWSGSDLYPGEAWFKLRDKVFGLYYDNSTGAVRIYGSYGLDIGSNSAKFGNLHLSGNIYVAGTVDGVDIAAHDGGAIGTYHTGIISNTMHGTKTGIPSAHHSSVSNNLTITPANVDIKANGYIKRAGANYVRLTSTLFDMYKAIGLFQSGSDQGTQIGTIFYHTGTHHFRGYCDDPGHVGWHDLKFDYE